MIESSDIGALAGICEPVLAELPLAPGDHEGEIGPRRRSFPSLERLTICGANGSGLCFLALIVLSL
jgi:hypothetical protein